MKFMKYMGGAVILGGARHCMYRVVWSRRVPTPHNNDQLPSRGYCYTRLWLQPQRFVPLNVMIMDNDGFLLDLDCAFNWMEALELAGEEVSEEAWAAFVEKYNEQVADIVRPASAEEKVPGLIRKDGMKHRRRADSGKRWTERLKVEERTVCHCPSRRRYKR